MSSKNRPSINRLIELHAFLLEFHKIQRILHIPESYRAENDTEHSFILTLMAWYLSEYFPHLDTDKVIRLALVHDLVEIHAGDTYIYGHPDDIASKADREAAALSQLKHEWPDFSGMTNSIQEYEERSSEEAKFVYALDKIAPIILIYLGNGYSWHKAGVTLNRLHKVKKDKVAVSTEINEYYRQLYNLLQQSPELFPSTKANSKEV